MLIGRDWATRLMNCMSVRLSFGEEGKIVMKCNSLSVVVELEKMGLSLDWLFPNVSGMTRDCFKEHVERVHPDSASRLLELWDKGLWDDSIGNDVRGRQFDLIGIPTLLAHNFSEWCRSMYDALDLVTAVRHALDVTSIMFPHLPAPWVVADCLKGYVHMDPEVFREIVSMRVSESVMIPLLVCRTWAVTHSMEPLTCVAMVRSHLKLMADCFSRNEGEEGEENE